MKSVFEGVSTKNALLTLYTIMIFSLIIYLSLLYNAADMITTGEQFTVQAIYSVGISLLVAITGVAWICSIKEK